MKDNPAKPRLTTLLCLLAWLTAWPAQAHIPAAPFTTGNPNSATASLQLATGGHVRGQRTRATLGRGEITATEPATTLTTLNRDLDAFQTVTANRNTGGLNVDVTVDRRMLSAEGWKAIARDFADTWQHGKDIGAAIGTVAEDEHIGLAQLGLKIRDNAILSQTENWLSRTEEGQAVLAGLKSEDPARSLAAQQALGRYLQIRFGLDPRATWFYDAGRTTNPSLADTAYRDIWGATVADPSSAGYGEIYLDVNGPVSKERLTASLGHEVVESDYLRGQRNLLFADSRETREAMADRFGIGLTERLRELSGGELGARAAWQAGVWRSEAVAAGTWQADRLGVVETRNLEWLAAGRDQFGLWSSQTLDNIADLDNRNSAERLLAAAGGVGAGVFLVGEGALATANYLGNWQALSTVDQFNDEWGKAHAEEIRQSHESLRTFFQEIVKEDVRAGIGLNAWDTAVRMSDGDTRAIGEFTSFFGALGTGAVVPGGKGVPRPEGTAARELAGAASSMRAVGDVEGLDSVGAARVRETMIEDASAMDGYAIAFKPDNGPSDSIGESLQERSISRPVSATRTGVIRKNASDWRVLRNRWDELGYGEILSPENRAAIARGRTPKVDDAWVKYFPEDRGLVGERIPLHHIQGSPITVPLPETRHLNTHMPGGFRYNPGGPGSALPFYTK